MKHKRDRKFRLRIGAAAILAAGAAAVAATLAQGSASTAYPVNYHFSQAFPQGFPTPVLAPPGADNWSCKPSAAHPEPVVLVHGTFENMNDDWRAAAPLLANHGYCVYAFDYGGATPLTPTQGTGPIENGAAQLSTFVDKVLASTGAAKVDLVGHSQGGMMPRYYLKFLGGAAKTDKLVALSPTNNGTTLDGLTTLGTLLHAMEPANAFLTASDCAACVEQEVGSDFLRKLNSGGETEPSVHYTVIATRDDQVATPYTTGFLPAAPNVTDITVQDQCALDQTDHTESAYDPIALTDVLNALDPAHPQTVPCQVVRPMDGPLT